MPLEYSPIFPNYHNMNAIISLLPAGLRNNITAATAVAVLLCIAIHSVGLVVYRLFMAPLAGFPGSKIAAATHFYEFFFDWWCQGKYIYEIEKMHKRYGLKPFRSS